MTKDQEDQEGEKEEEEEILTRRERGETKKVSTLLVLRIEEQLEAVCRVDMIAGNGPIGRNVVVVVVVRCACHAVELAV